MTAPADSSDEVVAEYILLAGHFDRRLVCGERSDLGVDFVDVTSANRIDTMAVGAGAIAMLTPCRLSEFLDVCDRRLTRELSVV